MPYIEQGRRSIILDQDDEVDTIGELNFWVTTSCLRYLNGTDMQYTDYNAIIGVLECAKLEFYRRAMAKYEDEKIKKNGDVYV